jgi:hypothetical protein
MRKIALFGLSLGTVMTLSSHAAFAKCGAFDMFAGDDYCLKCPSVRPEKIYMCPGGAPGFAAVTVSHPNCNVAFYDPTCGDRRHLKKPR